MADKDGGPAFPCDVDSTQPLGRQVGNTVWQTYGMTLRDYFAAQAMPEVYQRVESGGFERVAKLAYEMADAMLKERDK